MHERRGLALGAKTRKPRATVVTPQRLHERCDRARAVHSLCSHPETSPIQDFLDRLDKELQGLSAGQVATDIPELAEADPCVFGIVLATVDGRVYDVGDTRRAFTLQSISKPLVYGVALEDRGLDRVRPAVGVEPSGEAFNSISLDAGTGRPLNPMINAGPLRSRR
jgi:glutaminase